MERHETIKKAIEKVNSGQMSYREAADCYDIPKSVLNRHNLGINNSTSPGSVTTLLLLIYQRQSESLATNPLNCFMREYRKIQNYHFKNLSLNIFNLNLAKHATIGFVGLAKSSSCCHAKTHSKNIRVCFADNNKH
jgi:hypothetical protein